VGAVRRCIDVPSATARDFQLVRHAAYDHEGRATFVGCRYGAFFSGAKPFYLDASRVVLSSESGLLLCVDTGRGRTKVLQNCRAPIVYLDFDRATRIPIVGGADNSARVLRD
jgi:hypothetical protein